MFERPAAKPWCRPLASAASESRVSAGAKQRPAPSEVTISAARTVPSDLRERRSRPSPRRRSPGRSRRAVRRPTRSERRPAIGASIASSAGAGDEAGGDHAVAAAEGVDPQRHQHLDRAEHHRGHGDEERGVEDRPAQHRRRRPRAGPGARAPAPRASARRRRRGRAVIDQHRAEDQLGPDRGGEPRPAPGPSRAPATAVPSAVPITEPRRSSGAAVISQVSAPDQISAPATPWVKRVASSRTISWTKPKTRLETPSSSRPADHRPPRPDPAGDEARRQRGEQGPRRVGRRRGSPPGPCSDRARRRSPAAAARSPRRRRRRRRSSPRRAGAAGACPIQSMQATLSAAGPLAFACTPPEGWQSG